MIFKKGDKVFDHLHGWGEVVYAYVDGKYPVWVRFGQVERFYTQCGRLRTHQPPTLSFTEYTLEGLSQERPEELPKKGQLVYVKEYEDDAWNIRFFSHKENDCYYCFRGQRKSGKTHLWRYMETENPLLNSEV